MNDLAEQYPEIIWKIYWTKGYESGVEAERKRVLQALRLKAESRSILETLSYPFLLEELQQTILERQDD